MPPKTTIVPNLGRKIERIRTLKGIKQETLAALIGISQSTLSKIEQSASIDDEKLQQIASALGVPEDAIKNFNEENVMNTINSFHDSSAFNYQCQFNPIDKIVELYERLLDSERKRNELLESMLKNNDTGK